MTKSVLDTPVMFTPRSVAAKFRNSVVDTFDSISQIVQLPDNTYEFLRFCGAAIAVANSKLPHRSEEFAKLTHTVNTIKLYTDAVRFWGDFVYFFPRLTGETTYVDKLGNTISEKKAKKDPDAKRVFARKSEFMDDLRNQRYAKITAQTICLFTLDLVSPFYFFQENGGKFADRFFEFLSDLNVKIGDMVIYDRQPFLSIKNVNLEQVFRGCIAAVMAGFALHSINTYNQIDYYQKDKKDPRVTDNDVKEIFNKGDDFVRYKKNVVLAEAIANVAEVILQTSSFFVNSESLKFQYLILTKTSLGLASEWMKTRQFNVPSA